MIIYKIINKLFVLIKSSTMTDDQYIKATIFLYIRKHSKKISS